MSTWVNKERKRLRRRELEAARKELAAEAEVAKFDAEHFDTDLGWQLHLHALRRPLCPPPRHEGRRCGKRRRLGGGVASCDASDPCDDSWDNRDKCRQCRAKAKMASCIAAACSAARPSRV